MKKVLFSLSILFTFMFCLFCTPTTYAMDVPLAWTTVTDAVGYFVFYKSGFGTEYNGVDADQGVSPIDVGDILEITITGLNSLDPYFFKIIPYDFYGLPGPASEPIRTYQVTQATSLSSDGTYYVDDILTLKLYFIEQLTSDGPIYLTMNTGNVVEVAPFTAQYDIQFNYTVQPGDNVGALDISAIVADPNTLVVHTNTATPTCLSPPIGHNLIDNATLLLLTSTLSAPTLTLNCL